MLRRGQVIAKIARGAALTAVRAAIVAGILTALVGGARRAGAESNVRVVVDGSALEPSLVLGQERLLVWTTAVDLNGDVVDVPAKAWKLAVGGSDRRSPLVGRFASSTIPLAIVLVIESTSDYGDELPRMVAALRSDLAEKLPERTLLGVIRYGETVTQVVRPVPVKTAATKLVAWAPEPAAGPPALLDAVDRALAMLRRLPSDPPGLAMRKMIVVVSDGRDRTGDRERTTRLGKRALTDGVRVHSLAYSPSDTRRPLLALGELSRQSLGTFRWVRTSNAQAFRDQVVRLRDEVMHQFVLLYLLSDDESAAGKKLQLSAAIGGVTVSSNTIKAGALGCAKSECRGACVRGTCVRFPTAEHRGLWGWVFWIAVALVVAAVVLSGIGALILRRQRHGEPSPAAASMHGAAPPVSMPSAAAAVSMPGAPAAPAAPSASSQTSGPRLVFLSGPRTGQVVSVVHGTRIGQAASCHVVLSDGFASGEHADLIQTARDEWSVHDRGSTNGTFVNGVRVSQARLSHGVTLRVGSTDFRFLAE